MDGLRLWKTELKLAELPLQTDAVLTLTPFHCASPESAKRQRLNPQEIFNVAATITNLQYFQENLPEL